MWPWKVEVVTPIHLRLNKLQQWDRYSVPTSREHILVFFIFVTDVWRLKMFNILVVKKPLINNSDHTAISLEETNFWDAWTQQCPSICLSINQSVYYAQGSTIEYSKQNEYKMKTTREYKTTLKNAGKIMIWNLRTLLYLYTSSLIIRPMFISVANEA